MMAASAAGQLGNVSADDNVQVDDIPSRNLPVPVTALMRNAGPIRRRWIFPRQSAGKLTESAD